jgi:hypothetical protein
MLKFIPRTMSEEGDQANELIYDYVEQNEEIPTPETFLTKIIFPRAIGSQKFREIVPHVIDYGSAEAYFRMYFLKAAPSNRTIVHCYYFQEILEIYDFDPNHDFFVEQFKLIAHTVSHLLCAWFFKLCIEKGLSFDNVDIKFLSSMFLGSDNKSVIETYRWLRLHVPEIDPLEIFKEVLDTGKISVNTILDDFKKAGFAGEILVNEKVIELFFKAVSMRRVNFLLAGDGFSRDVAVKVLAEYFPIDTILKYYLKSINNAEIFQDLVFFAKNGADITGNILDIDN